MKVFGIPVSVVGEDTIFQSHLSQAEMDTLLQADLVAQRARQRAAHLLWKSRFKIRQLRATVSHDLQVQLEEEKSRLQEATSQDVKNAVENAVSWLLSEQALESRLLHLVQERAVRLVAETLSHWQGEMDWEPLIARRLAELSNENHALSTAVLYIHESRRVWVKQHLPLDCNWRIQSDDTLQVNQARLENDVVCIVLDMNEEFQSLSQRLAQQIREKGPIDGSQ